jgi:hypothetical protein
MCFIHNFKLTDCSSEKIFVNGYSVKYGFITTWVCSKCNKKIDKKIYKGESGWKMVKNFLK